MKTLPWRRSDLIAEIRQSLAVPDVRLPTSKPRSSKQLRCSECPLRTLTVAQLQFLASAELGALLEQLPRLMRRLATTTTSEEEWSAERVRGAIQWWKTLSMRAQPASRTSTSRASRRAFQTPENEILVHLLDETVRLGKLSGWYRSTSEMIGRMFSERVN